MLQSVMSCFALPLPNKATTEYAVNQFIACYSVKIVDSADYN